jgi:hypothetical protein
VYLLLKWPLLVFVGAWIAVLGIVYVMTRFYISQYEYWITWRGERERLRKRLRAAKSYEEWREAAKRLDEYLGAEQWKEEDQFAYYDHATVGRIVKDLRRARERAQLGGKDATTAADELRGLVEMCVKNNFAGIESARMYSQTYFGTKHLVQGFVDEGRWFLFHWVGDRRAGELMDARSGMLAQVFVRNGRIVDGREKGAV